MKKFNLTPQNTIVNHTKTQEISGDVNHEMYYDALGKRNADAAYEEDGINLINNGNYFDYYPIKIAKLRKFLDILEKKGCNYVGIDYNCDHPDFTFYGVDVHAASEDEIEAELIRKRLKNKQEAELLRLKAEELLLRAKSLEK